LKEREEVIGIQYTAAKRVFSGEDERNDNSRPDPRHLFKKDILDCKAAVLGS